jgi:hypothetical protein
MSISRQRKKEVRERAGDCCEYCHFARNVAGISFHVDHVLAIKHGGSNDTDNLCFACYPCNSYKGSNIAAADLMTKRASFLFNPREHEWEKHFEIMPDARIVGRSPEGRTTVNVLRMNDEQRLQMRQMAIELGEYPCNPDAS